MQTSVTTVTTEYVNLLELSKHEVLVLNNALYFLLKSNDICLTQTSKTSNGETQEQTAKRIQLVLDPIHRRAWGCE